MALFNYATKEITLKIVYYGPGLSGKTTNLQYLHSVLNPETKGKLLSLSTESDRTLFFDFLPIELGKIRDFSIRFQLYTVPGQVRYNATRKVVLKGADAIVFVADSQRAMREQNMESFANMRENLYANNINPDEIAVVLQYNKRDLKEVCTPAELNSDLNPYNYHVIEATAVNGQGVEDTFKLITKLLLKYISKKHKIEIQPLPQKDAVETAPPMEAEPAMAEAIPVMEQEEIPALELHDDTTEIVPEYTVEPEGAFPEYTIEAEKASGDRPEIVPEYTSEPEKAPGAVPEYTVEIEKASGDRPEIVPEYTAEIEKASGAGPGIVPEYKADIEKPSAPRPLPARQEPEVLPATDNISAELRDMIIALTARMEKMTDDIAGLQGSMDALQKTVLAPRADKTTDDIAGLQGSVDGLQKTVEKLAPGMKDIKDMKQGQTDLLRLMKDLTTTLAGLKEKKNWFKI
ncbi:MAG: hypothetical protein EPN25_01520 [Nitrospirae bacterium]|nr:MAG: hypothetical protein EPN25_01520 [Nitrospirota bacterium]